MKKTIQNILVPSIATAIASVAAPAVALAQVACSSSAAICNPLQATSVTGVLNLIVSIAIPVGATLAVLAFIFVGFKFIAAQGKPEEINTAWKWFFSICIGTAILIGAKLIITVITGSLTSAGVVQQGLFNQ